MSFLISLVQRAFRSNFVLAILYFVLIGLAIPLNRIVSLEFSPVANNTFRFFCGTVFFSALAYALHPQELKSSWRSLGSSLKALVLTKGSASKLITQDRAEELAKVPAEHRAPAEDKANHKTSLRWHLGCMLTSLFLALNMNFYMIGLAETSSTVLSVLFMLSAPLNIFVATVVFPDERTVAGNPVFILGTSIMLVGSAAFIAANYFASGQGLIGDSPDFFWGIGALVLAITFNLLTTLVIKVYRGKKSQLVYSSTLMLYTTLFSWLLSFNHSVVGELWEVLMSDWKLVVFLGFVGIYGLTVGMLLSVYIIQTRSVSLYQIFNLFPPVSTALFAWLLLGEHTDVWQFVAMALVIAGGYITIRAQK